MNVVWAILGLFSIGASIGLIIHLRWGKVCPDNNQHEECNMSRKTPKAVKKSKPNLNKPPVKLVVHLDYLRVYHEVLKHEEVLDTDLDEIFNTTIAVMRENLADLKMSNEPEETSIESLVEEVLDRLELYSDLPF